MTSKKVTLLRKQKRVVGKDPSFIFRHTDFEHQKYNLELEVWAEDRDVEKNL